MKYSRSEVRKKAHALPTVKFEDQALTSFSGLVVFQKFFTVIGLRGKLDACFRHLAHGKVFSRAAIFLQLVIHCLIGYRDLQHSRYYNDDPLVKRVLGLKRLPDVSTLSRFLKQADAKSVDNLRRLLRDMVIERLQRICPARITLDFDGSVQSTKRRAEGTAVGFNKRKKGARSYYPLFCTVAQTGQVFDVLHRPGNVHDSNGAKAFILQCIAAVKAALPGVRIEVRLDSAFFSDEIVSSLDEHGVDFTISVPFERFTELKGMIEDRRRWHSLDDETWYFETLWKPKAWSHRFRFMFVRRRARKQQKGPVQLDLFEPHEHGYEFKVIVTNKTIGARSVVVYHEGRGSQEGVFAELKSHCHLDYVPVRTQAGNQMYLLAGLFAHNLCRELQMQAAKPSRRTTANRAALWVFERVGTIRNTLLARAGRITRPKGVFTLTVSANPTFKDKILALLNAIPHHA